VILGLVNSSLPELLVPSTTVTVLSADNNHAATSEDYVFPSLEAKANLAMVTTLNATEEHVSKLNSPVAKHA